MHLTPRDQNVIDQLSFDQRVSTQSAAYTIYVALTPSNKKPVSQREFHNLFRDNWEAFARLEDQAQDID